MSLNLNPVAGHTSDELQAIERFNPSYALLCTRISDYGHHKLLRAGVQLAFPQVEIAH